MTTKEAAERFGIKEREVQKQCREGKIAGASKHGRGYYIPDDTLLILTDEAVCDFTRLLLKYKNNPGMILSNSGALDTVQKRRIWYEYLMREGIIGNCEFSEDLNTMLNRMQLTDEGLEIAFKKIKFSTIKSSTTVNVPVNLNVACVNVG